MDVLDLYAKISIDTSEYEEGLQRAGDSTDGLSAITVAAGKLIADAFEKALSAIKTYVSYAVQSSMDYESAFAGVTTIMDDTQLSASDMSDAILDLSSQMGIGADDIADSVYNVISATGDTAHAVSLVETATKLAKGGMAETADATSVLTTAINAYGLEMTDATSIADSLITVQNLGVTTVGELSQQMGKAIATGASYGVNLSNLETGYIALTKAGIGTAESTTYMSSMINELGDAGSDVAGILQEKTGKSFGQLMADGNSLADVIGILSDSVNGDSEAMANLWSSAEAGKASSAIASQGLEEFNGWLDEVQNSAGATETAYATMSDTTESKIAILKTAWQNMSIEVMEPLMDKLGEMVPKVTEFIQGIDTDAISQALSDVIDKLDEAFPMITEFIDGIDIESVGQTITDVMNNLAEAFPVITEFISGIDLDFVIQTVTDLAGIISNLVSVLSNPEIIEIIGAIVAGFMAFSTVISIVSTLTTLVGVFGGVMGLLTSPIFLVASMIGILVAAGVVLINHWDEVKAGASALWTAVVQYFTNLYTSTVATIQNMVSSVTSKFNSLKSTVTNTISNLVSSVGEKFSSVKEKMTSAISSAQSTISGIISSIRTTVSGIFDGICPKLNLSLPHISVSGGSAPWGIGGQGSLPSFSVSWYAKAMENGLEFTSPTVLATTSGLKGFGDAGNEIVIGEESLMGKITRAEQEGSQKTLEVVVKELEEMKALLKKKQIIELNGRDIGRAYA